MKLAATTGAAVPHRMTCASRDAGAHAHAVHMHEYATSTDLVGSEHEVDAEEGDGCIQSVAECHACERS
jgi:hypothetical protein